MRCEDDIPLGIGEEFGPRKPGSSISGWIVDHVAVFQIKQGPDAGKYAFIWINDKNLGGKYATSKEIARDLRNQYNLMRMNTRNERGEALILSNSKKDWTNRLTSRLQRSEIKSWNKIKGLMQEGEVVENYGLYCAMQVIETPLENGKKVEDLVIITEAFQPQGMRIGDILNQLAEMSRNTELEKIIEELGQLIGYYDEIFSTSGAAPISHLVIWPDDQNFYHWEKIVSNIRNDALIICYSFPKDSTCPNMEL